MADLDTELTASHRKDIFAYILKRVRDRDLAEDLTQDTMTRLYEYSSRAEVRSMRALAYKAAENVVRSQFRKAGRRHHTPIDSDLPDTAPCSEQVVMDRQRLDLLKQVIASLSPRRREVLLRRRVQGESFDAIASSMGLSRAGVEKHLTRALGDLRKGMDEHALPPSPHEEGRS